MTPIDYVIVAGYFLVMLAVGIAHARKASSSLRNYSLALLGSNQ